MLLDRASRPQLSGQRPSAQCDLLLSLAGDFARAALNGTYYTGGRTSLNGRSQGWPRVPERISESSELRGSTDGGQGSDFGFRNFLKNPRCEP
jgi:hypothetical protein